ncbi:uncharacterized protein LOC9653921 isoform X1 [Selaginella moellendorffii]|nr:uncharacterized protein LOC9653921 isoform X1 [Selaginella moellendorffii]|eukprot:XP_002964138.2 uncharacterized protein LOC9653921 isoform X1 [Selaginella moellendorffii]
MAILVGSPRAPTVRSSSTLREEDPSSRRRPEMEIVEPSRPRFDRIPYAPSSAELLNPKLIQPHVKPARFWRPQRGWGKSYKKPTPQQSITGSVLGALCAAGAFKGVTASYDHLSTHPLVHNAPFGLTDDVNQALATTVLGLGWLAISLFAASSVGLALLSAKLLTQSSADVSKRSFAMALLFALSCAFTNSVGESDASTGAETFQRSCIGCHARGGNILQAGATLGADDLQRNGISTVEDIVKITYYGKGRMPGFGEGCKPQGQCTFASRLSDQDIQALAEFVKSQADQGWPRLD